jgi:hypothetical protein
MKHMLYLLIVTTLDSGHAIGPLYSITQTGHINNKGSRINTQEKYNIYIGKP